ncbi:MAG TPA: hypothetical protein VGS99_07650 [Gammaproteobacteria bacterium]|nr:hypothetical protein [Gammaproteobacteria bacterium]
MKSTALLIFATLLCGCSFVGKPQGGSTAEYLEVHGPALGWDGLSLYQTRQSVEQALGKSLKVDPQAAPACGQFASKLKLHGRDLVLQWSSADETATLDSLRIVLPEAESAESVDALTSDLQQRVPDLVVLRANRDSAILRYAANQRVVLNLHGEGNLWITYQACLD